MRGFSLERSEEFMEQRLNGRTLLASSSVCRPEPSQLFGFEAIQENTWLDHGKLCRLHVTGSGV